MNDLQIDYFMAVATNLSFTKTSEELFVSQPAISRQISQLEKELGCKLFKRNNQGTALTEEGRLYFDLFSNYKAEFINTKVKAERIAGKNKAVIRVGFLEGWDLFGIIPPMIGRFNSEYPDIEVVINCCGVKELTTSLLNDTLDIVVTMNNSLKPFSEFSTTDVADISKILLFSSNHPLAANEIIVPEELAPYPEMIYGDTALPHQPPRREETDMSHIVVFDRLMQFELLSHVPGAYMWTSPESETTLRRFGLVQRPCPESSPHFHDVLIYPAAYTLSQLDCRFMDLLDQAKIRLNSQSAQQNVF